MPSSASVNGFAIAAYLGIDFLKKLNNLRADLISVNEVGYGIFLTFSRYFLHGPIPSGVIENPRKLTLF